MPRDLLISTVRELILPNLLSCGLFISRDNADKRITREDYVAVIDLRRITGESVEIINFQFDAHLRPRFVINAAKYKGAVSIDFEGKKVPHHKVRYEELPESVQLTRIPPRQTGLFVSGWFGPSMISRLLGEKQAAQNACQEALSLMGQIYDYFESGALGANLTRTQRHLTPEGKLTMNMTFGPKLPVPTEY